MSTSLAGHKAAGVHGRNPDCVGENAHLEMEEWVPGEDGHLAGYALAYILFPFQELGNMLELEEFQEEEARQEQGLKRT